MNKEQQEACNSLKEMIDSCFTYGGAERDNPNFNRYILPYKEKLGGLFDKIYQEHLETLKNHYQVINNVYTDGEGLTYNSLEKIEESK